MSTSSNLCLDCGMCCDGTLFENFRIKYPKESHLFSIDQQYIPQRCEHLDNCNGCKIYEKRPKVCSTYKCPVLRKYEEGDISFQNALEHITSVKNDPKNKEKIKNFIDGTFLK